MTGVVDPSRLELLASCVSSRRSNQLSYGSTRTKLSYHWKNGPFVLPYSPYGTCNRFRISNLVQGSTTVSR